MVRHRALVGLISAQTLGVCRRESRFTLGANAALRVRIMLFRLLFEHDLFGKPLRTIPDNAPADFRSRLPFEKSPQSEAVEDAAHLCGEVFDMERLREKVRAEIKDTIVHDGIAGVARSEEHLETRP